jgi:predicted nucleotidyltransferase
VSFGSALHGTDTGLGDVDLLADALPGATLFDLGGLPEELEELLAVPTDLLTPADIPSQVRDHVRAEAVPVSDWLRHIRKQRATPRAAAVC